MNKLVELYNNIAPDKKGHITLGLLLGLAFGANLKVAIIVILAVAIGKEVYDYLYNHFVAPIHEVSALDALATTIGGAIGVGVIALIHYVGGLL